MSLLLTAALSSSVAAAARAEDTLELERVIRVQPGATCLNADALIEHIATWLGTTSVASDLEVDVIGNSKFARYLSFRVRRGGVSVAERHFEPGPAQCADLHAAVGLAIALSMKASLLDTLGRERNAARTRVRREWAVVLEAAASYRVLPALGFGASVRAERALTRRVELRLALFEQNSLRARLGAGELDAQLLAAKLELCTRLWSWPRARLDGCAGFAAGMIWAHGHGFAPSLSGHGELFAWTNALSLRVDLSASWSVRASVEMLMPLRRSSFVSRDRSDAIDAEQSTSAVGALLSIGPSYAF